MLRRFSILLSVAAASAFLSSNFISAQDALPSWVSSALRAQTILSADTDVSQLSLCGANGVFNTLAYSPPMWRAIRPFITTGTGSACLLGRCLKGVTDIQSQTLSVTELLDLGIRRVSVNLQYTPTLAGDVDLRLCRGDTHFYTGCQNLISLTGFDICTRILGVPVLTRDSTGCSESAAGLAQGLTIINDWIAGKAADLSYDIFVIDIGDFVTSNVPGANQASLQTRLNTIFRDSIGNLALTVTDLQNFRRNAGVNSTAWPSPREMVDTYKKRVILLADAGLVANAGGDVVHSRSSPLSNGFEAITTINMYRSRGNLNSCPATVAPFHTTYESRKVLTLDEVNDTQHIQQLVSRENGPSEIGLISAADATMINNCGVSPSLDRIDASRIGSNCVWTYSASESAPADADSNENVVFNADSGWTTTSANVSTLRKACRQNTDNNNWTVSAVGEDCPLEYTFAIPATSTQSYQLRLVLRAASVTTVLLPSNVSGVTRQATQPPLPTAASSSSTVAAASSSSTVAAASSSNTVAIAVGICVPVVVLILVVVVVVVVIYKKRSQGQCRGDQAPVVKSDLDANSEVLA